MGRDSPPPEQADSWGEFHARIERERAALDGNWSALWRSVAAVVFVAGLLCCAYASQGRDWWLWIPMFVALSTVGMMASRALSNAERHGNRAAQLDRMEQEWQAHLERHSPRG
jgi:hypothetical protein